MNIEQLFTRFTPKTVNMQPLPKGVTKTTAEEVMVLLSILQHQQPLGSAVLSAQISQDKQAYALCVHVAHQWLLLKHAMTDVWASAIAKCATENVCSHSVCKRCNGIGESFSRKYNKIFECTQCKGSGQQELSQLKVFNSVISLLPETEHISRNVFSKKYYDNYLNTVSLLRHAASQAAALAKELVHKHQ